MESEKKIKSYLVKRIEGEGYPLEIEISNILDNRKRYKKKLWLVNNNVYFFDPELKKGRTIDIAAINLDKMKDSEEMNPFFSVCRLIIECKKSDSQAWIFFTRPHTSFSHYHGQILDFVKIKTNMKNFCFGSFLGQYSKLDKPCLHYEKYKRIAVSYTELMFDKSKRKSKSSLDQILKASNQLMKFISYRNKRIVDTNLEGWSGMPFYFYFPVVLFEGRMYQYFEDAGKRNLVPVKRVLLETGYYPSYYYQDVQFAIEIVTKDAFEALLKDIEKDCSTVYSGIISANKELLDKYSKFIPKDVLKNALLRPT